MKHILKNIVLYLILSFICSIITVFYAENKLSNLQLIFECVIYYFIVIFLNNLIIRWFYLKTNFNSFFKILLNIIIGLFLLTIVRFCISPFAIYNILSFDLFIVILLPMVIIIDVNLDIYIRKSYDKFNLHLRSFRNNR